jgi:hypothetical protein
MNRGAALQTSRWHFQNVICDRRIVPSELIHDPECSRTVFPHLTKPLRGEGQEGHEIFTLRAPYGCRIYVVGLLGFSVSFACFPARSASWLA